ncbi:MAG: Rne/Rng family ribonuclease, partial [Deltaproteobacteria bacterium]|nr:Rne/Rng family ribonuclease [Deltaproteobacteria bacterium]
MTRTMLINGRHAEELRVAIIEDRELVGYEVEIAENSQKRGNIYRGVVGNIEKSLGAAFIDFGDGKSGFLAAGDVVEEAYHHKNVTGENGQRPRIDQMLQKGRPILIQVQKEAVGSKGAALTTNISIAGRYLVFLPRDASQRGLSRKVEDEALRRKIKEKARALTLPEGAGYIVRTNAVDETKEALQTDLTALTRLWSGIMKENEKGDGPATLYDDQDLVVQAMRDYLDSSIERVLIDDKTLFDRAETYLAATMPDGAIALELYGDRVPLFSRYNLEPQISVIYKRTVPLPSGASIVIDHTEALTAIDVNSGKARGESQEDTAYQTNLEAAVAVARQLRLRDIGGLVVVDFIDMRSRGKQRAVEKTLKEELKKDRARHSSERISANGLLEINRQRIRQALAQRTHRLCPVCEGTGRLLTPELVGLNLLRRIEARAATGRLDVVRVWLPPEQADAMQNRRRRQLADLEREYHFRIEILSDPRLERGSERIDWKNHEGPSWPGTSDKSEEEKSEERSGERERSSERQRTSGRQRSGRHDQQRGKSRQDGREQQSG